MTYLVLGLGLREGITYLIDAFKTGIGGFRGWNIV